MPECFICQYPAIGVMLGIKRGDASTYPFPISLSCHDEVLSAGTAVVRDGQDTATRLVAHPDRPGRSTGPRL